MEQHLKQSSPFGLFLRLISTFWQTRTTRRKPSVWLRAMLTVAVSSMLLATGGLATAKETVTYIHSDISGSPLAATDAAGNVLWKESYFAYGQKTEWQPESEAQTQWFHGKEQDADTTMQYFGARYYDPGIGRFLGIDPVDYQDGNLHSFNRYAYGNNNPTKYLDPDGRIAFLIPFALTATAHAARTVALRFAVTATVNASRVGIVAGEIAAGDALGGAALAGGAVLAGATAVKSVVQETAKVGTLIATHGKTMGGKEFDRLTKRIRAEGILEPLTVTSHEGRLYILDGHHRALAAPRAGIIDVPITRVELPHGAYKTPADLDFTPGGY